MIVYMRDIALVKKMIRNKEFDNAEKCIEKILKSTKSAKIQGACYFYLGEIYKSHYDSEACQRQARDYYHKALQRDVNIPQAYTRFAFCEKDPPGGPALAGAGLGLGNAAPKSARHRLRPLF